MDTTADLGGKLPRLDSNQQPFGKQPLSAPVRGDSLDLRVPDSGSAPDRSHSHRFTDTKLTRDLDPEAPVSLDVAPDEIGPVPAELGIDQETYEAFCRAQIARLRAADGAPVSLEQALAPYRAKTDARRAGETVNW